MYKYLSATKENFKSKFQKQGENQGGMQCWRKFVKNVENFIRTELSILYNLWTGINVTLILNYITTKFVRKRKTKRRIFCEEEGGVPATARIQKILSKNFFIVINSFEVDPGAYTNSLEDFLVHLLNSHFPENTIFSDDLTNLRIETCPSADIWSIAGKIVNLDKLKQFVFSFSAFKSPVNDEFCLYSFTSWFFTNDDVLFALDQLCIDNDYVPVA